MTVTSDSGPRIASIHSQTKNGGGKYEDIERLRPLALQPLCENPLVSVLVTNYNYAAYIGEAIQSFISQTYTNFEVIVCDDGSTDSSCVVIESWCKKDPRVRLVRQHNQGQASALNTAFSVSKGEVIVLLDGDDLALERRLELVVKAFRRHPDAGMVTHALTMINSQGETSGRDPEEPLDEGWLAPALLRGPGPVFPPTSGLALRSEVAKRVFPLPCDRIQGADSEWDWVVREGAAFLAPVVALGEVPGIYRLHGQSLFGHSRLNTLEQIERRLAGLSAAMEGRRLYARRFLNTEPDPSECDLVVGVLILSRAVLLGEHLSAKQICRYSRGKSRWIWKIFFLLPPWLRKRAYLRGRKSQIPWKARRLKGQTVRLLERLTKPCGLHWKPGRRVRQVQS